MPYIIFSSGYKYQLERSYMHRLYFEVDREESSDYFHLRPPDELLIKRGYAWDGPSGLTIDTLNFMRGSLVHGALYQLIREGKFPLSRREEADEELRRICLEDGMSRFRAWYVYEAVRAFGEAACTKEIDFKRTIVAP